jgi:hypothetical protein
MTEFGAYTGGVLGIGAGIGLHALAEKHGFRVPKVEPHVDPRVIRGQKQIGMGHITDMKMGKDGVFRVPRVTLGEHARKLYQKVPKIPMSASRFDDVAHHGTFGLALAGAAAGGYGGYKLAKHMLGKSSKRKSVRRTTSRSRRG